MFKCNIGLCGASAILFLFLFTKKGVYSSFLQKKGFEGLDDANYSNKAWVQKNNWTRLVFIVFMMMIVVMRIIIMMRMMMIMTMVVTKIRLR